MVLVLPPAFRQNPLFASIVKVAINQLKGEVAGSQRGSPAFFYPGGANLCFCSLIDFGFGSHCFMALRAWLGLPFFQVYKRACLGVHYCLWKPPRW